MYVETARYKNFTIMNYTEDLNDEKLLVTDFPPRTCTEVAVCHNKATLSRVKAFSTEYFALAAEGANREFFTAYIVLSPGNWPNMAFTRKLYG